MVSGGCRSNLPFSADKALTGAMSAITAAVVGVIMNLAIWFALHLLFNKLIHWQAYGIELDVPVANSIHVSSLLLTLASIVAIFRFKFGMIPVLLMSSCAGIIWNAVT